MLIDFSQLQNVELIYKNICNINAFGPSSADFIVKIYREVFDGFNLRKGRKDSGFSEISLGF